MSVSNGQLANASTFNNAFVSKTANSTVSGDITMSGDLNLSGDLNSTGTITQDKESVLKEIATPATPASGYGKIYFKSDGKLYQMDDAGTETQVGSGAGGGGGGVNFITNGNAEGNVTTGWAVYADAAGTSPVDGTGGTANVTNTVTSTTPLAGTYSFLLAKDAANRQGQGWSYDFTIDQTYRAKVLQISFDYLVNSGTFTAGSSSANSDVTVWIYDITNAVLIQPSNIKLFSNNGSITDKFQASFQTASNSSSYRLIFHVTTTSASAYTLEVDNVSVSPSEYVFGTPVTDWQSYTPTFTGFGTVTNIEFQWRRAGDSLEVKGKATIGTATATEARVSFPNGLTAAGTDKIPSLQIAGLGARPVANAETIQVLTEPSVTYFTFCRQEATLTGLTKQNGNAVANAQALSFFARTPIAGWSSSVQTSDSADTRVVAALIRANTANQSITASTAISWGGGSVFDTHGAYNGTTSYTIPVSGFYEIKIGDLNTAASCYAYLYKNGSYETTLAYCDSGVRVEWGSKIVSLRAGDVLTIVPSATTTLQYSAGNYRADWSITRISGPSAISAIETVAARYKTAAGQSIPNNSFTVVNFDSKDIDTHSAVTTGTGWKFTASISGIYQVSALATWAGANYNTGSYWNIAIYKNGSVYCQGSNFVDETATSVEPSSIVSSLIQLNAGDYIDIRAYQNNGGASSLYSSSGLNYVSINRVGN